MWLTWKLARWRYMGEEGWGVITHRGQQLVFASLFAIQEDQMRGAKNSCGWDSCHVRRNRQCNLLATVFSELTTGTAVTDEHSLYNATKQVPEKSLGGIKELIQSKKIKTVLWSVTKAQPADCLPKKGASPLAILKALSEGLRNLT